MKIYTKTGDDGTTGLFGGPRVSKDHPRIETYGAIDELNSLIGIVRSMSEHQQWDVQLEKVQSMLFEIGSELATPNPEPFELKWNGQEAISMIEGWIDEFENRLEPLRNFILPAGSTVAAFLHLTRTVCRRAEREVVRLSKSENISDPTQIVVFLNRLSDYLFVTAREANRVLGQKDIPWRSSRADH